MTRSANPRDRDVQLTILVEAASLTLERLHAIIETIQSQIGQASPGGHRRLVPRRPVRAPAVVRPVRYGKKL